MSIPYPKLNHIYQLSPLQQPLYPRGPGVSFADFSAELRLMVYKPVLLTQKVLKISLNPTPNRRARDSTSSWGSRNRFALLSTCRQIHYETRQLAYSQNQYRILCPTHRDFQIPRAPSMPFDKICHLQLYYPRHFGACTYSLAHTWERWLQDALHITSRFRNLKRLKLINSYTSSVPFRMKVHGTWEPLFNPRESYTDGRIDFDKRVKRVVQSLAQINGRKMPSIVQIKFDQLIFGRRRDHCLHALNLAIPFASDPKMTQSKYVESLPRWRPKTD